MTAVDTEPLAWDPLNEKYKGDPHAIWKRLRDEAPLYYNEDLDFYAVSRFADVDAFSRDPKTFLSGHGTVMEMITADPVEMEIMIFMDPPEHTRYRRLVSKAFTPRRMMALEDEIRALCVRLLDDLAGPELLRLRAGLRRPRSPPTSSPPSSAYPRTTATSCAAASTSRSTSTPRRGCRTTSRPPPCSSSWTTSTKTLEDRKKNPQDDMFTDLLAMEITEDDGEVRRLTMDQAVNFAILIGSAGTETVARLLGWAGLTLDNNPEQRAELAADFSLLPNAVEELLRYEAPSPVQSRWCTADVELHGSKIPASSKVVMITGSAGRDDRAFPDADRFDIHRKMDHHVSFGYGIHFCLGAALARTEAKIALEETLKRYPEWSVDLDQAVPLYTSTVRGYSEAAHLRLTRSAARPKSPGGRPLHWPTHPALVAQRTRASDYGSEGWGFESLRARLSSLFRRSSGTWSVLLDPFDHQVDHQPGERYAAVSMIDLWHVPV